MTDEDVITKEEAAEILKVTPRYVLRLGREGRLPRVKLSHKTVRFRRADVEELVDELAGNRSGRQSQRRSKAVITTPRRTIPRRA